MPTKLCVKHKKDKHIMSTLRTDAIVDLAGNGKPDLTNGLQIGGVAVSSTAAELNILDGVTSTAAELNILDGVTSTAAELNILDGVTATAAEINLIDGGTARGTTAVADGDGFLTNDGGTMRMTKVETLATYMGTKVGGGARVFIASSGVVSDVAAIAFTNVFDSSKFDYYVFTMLSVTPANDAPDLVCQTSTDGGSNFETTNGNYESGQAADKVGLLVSAQAGSDTNEDGVFGDFQIFEVETSNKFTRSQSLCFNIQNNSSTHHFSSTTVNDAVSSRKAAEDNNAVRFVWTSGNIESGEIVMYGIANA